MVSGDNTNSSPYWGIGGEVEWAAKKENIFLIPARKSMLPNGDEAALLCQWEMACASRGMP